MTDVGTNDNRRNLKREEVIKRITQWLAEDGFTVNVKPSLKGYYYYANVTRGSHKCLVLLPSDKPDNIRIEVSLRFQSEDIKAFNRLNQNQKNRFFIDLQTTLIQIGVRTSVTLDADGNPQITTIHKEIYFDALTKHLFINFIYDILQAVGVARLIFTQFGDSIRSEGTK